MSVVELKNHLKTRNAKSGGNKAELLKRAIDLEGAKHKDPPIKVVRGKGGGPLTKRINAEHGRAIRRKNYNKNK